MLMIREIMYRKPGKVRAMVEKFLAMLAVMEKNGLGKMRVLTDVSAERYWTLVAEFEVESMDKFMAMDSRPDEGARAADEGVSRFGRSRPARDVQDRRLRTTPLDTLAAARPPPA